MLYEPSLNEYMPQPTILPVVGSVKANMSRIAKFMTAKKYIKNWPVIRKALHKNRTKTIDVEIVLKNDSKIHVNDVDDLVFIIEGLYYCDLFNTGPETFEIVQDMHDIASFVKVSINYNWGTNLKGIGGWPGSKEILLYLFIRKVKPNTVLETGVAQGISSTFILNALESNGAGHLTSIDLPNLDENGQFNEDGTKDFVHIKKELGVGWIVPTKLRKYWTLILGDAKEELQKLDMRPDIFFHDSNHSYEHMMMEFNWAFDNLPNNGILFSDDIGWNQSFRDFIKYNEGSVRKVMSNPNVGIAQVYY